LLVTALSVILYFIALLATIIIVGRWIYRASKNAHAISNDMTISPGWAVGWYFIPIASLFKPYQAMKEIVFASVAGSQTESRLPVWWGLWILTNILGNASFRISQSAPGLSASFDLVNTILSVPLYIVFASILRETGRGQDRAIKEGITA
jgi:hypothetical protein